MRGAWVIGVVLVGCGAAAPASRTEPVSELEPAAVSVDGEECDEDVSGVLRVERGTLLFVEGAAPGDEDDHAIAISDVSESEEEGEGEDEDEDEDDYDSTPPWGSAVPTVLALAAREPGALAPRVSQLVPGRWGQPVGVVEDGDARALVFVDADPSSPAEPIWEGAGDVILAGSYQEHLLVLERQRVEDGAATDAPPAVAFVLLGLGIARADDGSSYQTWQVLAREEGHVLPFAGQLELDAGLPYLAPRGDDRLVFPCDEDAAHPWCELTVGASSLSVAHVDGPDVSGQMRQLGPLALGGDGALYVIDGGFVPRAFLPPEGSADDVALYEDGAGLPVDGRLVDEIAVTLGRCVVRSGVDLPLLEDSGEGAFHSASIVETPHEDSAQVAGIDVLVRGQRFEVGLAYRDDAGEGLAAGRDLGLALAPGSIRVTPVRLGGQGFLHVEAMPAMPGVRSPDCVMGRIVIRVWSGAYGSQAILERYWEDGYCD